MVYTSRYLKFYRIWWIVSWNQGWFYVNGPKFGEFQVRYKERMDRMPMDLDSWCLNMPAPDTDQAATLPGDGYGLGREVV
jgi:hypothetical protein